MNKLVLIENLLSFIAISTFIIFSIGFLFFGSPNFGDMAGHFDSARVIKENFFPDFTGWNPDYFLGYQQGLFYPPLFHYSLAILMFFIPEYFAGSLIITLTLLFYVLSFYLFSKSFFKEKANHLPFVLTILSTFFLIEFLLDTTYGSPGGSNFATMIIGLLPAFLIIPLIILFLTFFYKALDNNNFLYPTIILAFCFLTHFSGFILLIFLIISITQFKEKRKQIIKMILISLGISSFWLLPFLSYSSYIPKVVFSPSLYFPFFILLIISIIITFLKKDKFVKTIGLTTCILAAIILLVYTLNIPFQIFRLVPIFCIFSMILIFIAITNTKLKYLKTILIIAISFFIIINIHNSPYPESTMVLIKNDIDLSGNVLILPSVNGWQQGLHAIPAEFKNQTKNPSVLGLFTEAANNSQIAFILAKYFQKNYPCWGVTCFEQRKFPKGVLEKQFNLLNISYLIFTKENSLTEKYNHEYYLQVIQFGQIKDNSLIVKNNYENHRDYFIYYLNDPLSNKLMEIPNKVIGIKTNNFNEWRSFVDEWIFDPDPTIYFLSNNEFEFNNDKNVNITILEETRTTLSVFIDSNTKVPVFLKKSWSPNWKAYDENNKEIEVFIASPYNMGFIATGKVTLKNELTFIEIFSRIFSLFCIVILILTTKKSINMSTMKEKLDKLKKKLISIDLKQKMIERRQIILFILFLIIIVFLLFNYAQSKNLIFYNEINTGKSMETINSELIKSAQSLPLEEIFIQRGDVVCFYKDNKNLFIKNEKVLFIDNNSGYYYNSREIINSIDLNIILSDLNYAEFFNQFGKPIQCELNSSKNHGMDEKIVNLIETIID